LLEANKKNKRSDAEIRDGHLPDLCSATAVLSLVLVGELLALALTIVRFGLASFDWSSFALLSFLIQWILLSSAATLCSIKRRLTHLSAAQAYLFSYLLVLGFTVFYTALGTWFISGLASLSWVRLFEAVLVAAIFAGILLRYFYLQQQLKRHESAELGARLQALQSRIRPHFLFNSLNSIASLIPLKPQQAENLVLDLASLFRASLQVPQLSTMKSEIDLSRRFAMLESVRLGERLHIDWQIDLPDENTPILNLLLQPLLENAIYHGIQPLPDGGTVVVEIKLARKDVVIKVTNPFVPGKADDLSESRSNGIALSNIRSRLSGVYGSQAYLRVVKGEGEFAVVVRYPIEHDSLNVLTGGDDANPDR
jgi:two-component system sensor histidine kinase AlgZ